MARYMASTDEVGSISSSGSERRNRNHRHSFYQIKKLEDYFKDNQHPNERERSRLGDEVGLTATQIKFWFQNKRTLAKTQTSRLEGNILKEENDRIRYENLAMEETLRDELCMICKGLSSNQEEKLFLIEQLRNENEQLNKEYERLRNVLAESGITPSEFGSFNALIKGIHQGRLPSTEFEANNIFGPAMNIEPNGARGLDVRRVIYTITVAIEELTKLMTVEELWMRDPVDGRYVIHREEYEKLFLSIKHLKSSSTQVESSKAEGTVRMRGAQLAGMLQDSSRRLDLFPTIITKATQLQQIGVGSSNLTGSLQLVFEQIHILSLLVAPREFDLIRYVEQVDDSSWLILEVSHGLCHAHNEDSHFRAWRFPSGCLIKDLQNGFSKVTWIEHVEVAGTNSIHHRYKDVLSQGLGYGAKRWIFTLKRMCDRYAYQMGDVVIGPDVEMIRGPGGRKSVMHLTQRMVKNFGMKLILKSENDNHPLSEHNDSETRVYTYKSVEPGLPNSLVVVVTTSIWIPLSPQAAFGFFTNIKNRVQWDVFSDGNQFQEIARIAYGNDSGSRISIIQPLVPGNNNTLLVQESCVDLQGGIIVYSPIHARFIDMVINGEDPSSIPIIPSGFIISSDGNNSSRSRDGASSSSIVNGQRGSLLSMVLQIIPNESSSSEQVNALIRSAIQKIKFALDSYDFE